MYVKTFRIPESLVKLIDQGKWPRSQKEALAQNIRPILGKEAIHAISADDDTIYLYCPPFMTIQDECTHNAAFWMDSLTNVGEIDYTKSVIIGDFGLGSDSAIILNYEVSEEPRVMYLKWSVNGTRIAHSWICSHPSFDNFAASVGLLTR